MYKDTAVIATGSDDLPLKLTPAPHRVVVWVFCPAPFGAVLVVEDSGNGVHSTVAAGLAYAATYNLDSGA